MKWFHEFAAVKAAVLLVAYLAVGTGSEQYHGQVLAVRPHGLTVTTKAVMCSFEVTSETKITLDGQSAELADLSVGNAVAVTAAQGADDPVAKKIEARTIVTGVDGNGDLAQGRTYRR